MAKNATCVGLTCIYALCDPTSGEIRYIGKTVRPELRIRQHVQDAMRGGHDHRSHWIRSLPAWPVLRLLSVVPDEIALDHERLVIAAYKKIGVRLTNGTEGGEGTLGCKKSAETRAKISAAKRANQRHCTPEEKARISAVHKGKVVPPETRARMAAGRRGMKFSESHRESMRQSRLGIPWTEAQRQGHLKRKEA